MRLLTVILLFIFSGTAMADKPEWAGKGKPTAEQKEAHKVAMNAKEDDEDVREDMDDARDAMEKKLKEARDMADKKDMAKMKEKGAAKDMADRKETDKGSEKGQQAREENSRAWWKFWED